MTASYLNLVENMADGYALCEALLDAKGEPYDYRYLEVNAAFERMMGVKRDQLIGRTIIQVFPRIEPYWLDALREVTVTGRAVRLEQYSQSIDLYLAITASSPAPGVVAVFLTDVTEQMRAEEALLESEARLKEAQRLAQIGSWELNLVDNVLIWSDEIYRIFEKDRAKFGASYEAFLEMVHPDDRAAVDLAYINSLKTHTPYSIDHRLLFPDGRIKYIREQCETFYEDDKPIRSLGTVQDITEIKRAERAVVESEMRLKMYKGFPVPTYTWRRQGDEFVLVEYNHAADEASGGKAHEMLGRKVSELYPGQFRLLQDMLCCIGGESPLRREARFPAHTSTEERDLIVTCVALPPDLVMVHMEDVTERRRAEEKLRQAAIVFESTLEGVIITDRERNITAVNRSFSDITGYAPQEALGKNPRFLRSNRHNSDFFEEIRISLQQTGKWQGEMWNRRKNGEVFPAWQNISAVKDESNRIVNYISVFSDISVIKAHEERMTYLAHHDVLTELPNRLLFSANLEQAIELARRHDNLLALMFIDLDDFKLVNDSQGHSAGDRMLQMVAKRLKLYVRAEDTVARLGGDEFTIIMNELSKIEDVAALAQTLVAAFEEPIDIGSYEHTIGISVGISLFPDDGTDSDRLTKAADAALYRAKERGRNRYEFYNPGHRAQAPREGAGTSRRTRPRGVRAEPPTEERSR